MPVANTVGRLYVTTDTNFIYRDNGSTWAALVTNLVLTAPSIFTVTGSPIIGSGTLGLALVPQAQNTVFSGPTAGVNAIPTFRTLGLVTNDISDVTVTTPGPNQILVYNGTKWVNTLANATLLRTWSRTFPVSSGTTIITPGAVAPLITAGTVIASQVITPISVASIYDMHFTLAGDTSANNVTLTAAIFRTVGGVSTYIGASIGVVAKVGSVVTLAVTLRDIPNTTSAVTYTVIFGTSSATWYLNRRVSEVTYGGLTSGLLITER